MILKKDFTISYEAKDILRKTIQKLPINTAFNYKRLYDDKDTYEIVISYLDKDIDMLSYQDSIYIAPYLDCEALSIDSIEYLNSKSLDDKTLEVNIRITFNYDEEFLAVFNTSEGEIFISNASKPLSMAAVALIDYEESLIEKTYLNQYVFSIDIDDDTMFLFDDFEFLDDVDCFFCCEVLFNDNFSKCKVSAFIVFEGEKVAVELSPFEKETFKDLVNHHRIFSDEEILLSEIEE